ncbi:PREDICTED: alpha-1,3-mannosyl-glycoprotein 4-beta-N-acetylglucosaminyltransferase C-like [Thamnophis sirtalis]|uniref:Alpha-1,3-mannosyl-glycoprotein 4-beta-N-acetylglucosaminyltransferase C-like n=1 Tax=Thamnophis sirtalis TaxID=35019 RepID=A0A6I9XLE7_9SAUR|nr:PREDICTED: alpha-1,3-mannosyl-glycoprotein 4-beta-N-acetylglucosaminyltransferase C-like [Thamnophis sirtalis]XP_013914792.1 PREDICTED: alpha-1,3-mannosyl-glycoprotein 4-beta-N-acetylglucosaminyltransferase C-like [Thamnophis sirtalis]XP_013914793.1 PREDICTED: alpha-1,3-mannosyl-glycoprotein 4-beta-N-acetylglucosaminyltransferase C-like [Thamnophis sirtalis]
MRCSLKRSLATAFSLCVFLLIMYLASWHHEDLVMNDVQKWAQTVGLHPIATDWTVSSLRMFINATNTLNISYDYLVGSPPLQKKFLTLGLCSVKRMRQDYLLNTLTSIFEQSSEEEMKEMVVVVHLTDPDHKWNSQMALEIARSFPNQLHQRNLVVIHTRLEYYPPLEGLKRNFNDPEDRVRFRSKQNVDYAYLMNFASNLSTYYLMIEDDVRCTKHFLTVIKRNLASQEGTSWVTLEFSKLGYIAKLYRSTDLPRLTRFLMLFYQEMPCDWLFVHFRLLLTQKEEIRFRQSLFQHVGHYSSFQGTLNKLEDEDFEEDFSKIPDNPPADIITDIATFRNSIPSKAYSSVIGYFWGKAPSVGNSFTLIFKKAAPIFRIQIHTGSKEFPESYLHEGLVALGTNKLQTLRPRCANYITIGHFTKGIFDKQNLENSITSDTVCVQILVTNTQSESLIISNISIWIKPKA